VENSSESSTLSDVVEGWFESGVCSGVNGRYDSSACESCFCEPSVSLEGVSITLFSLEVSSSDKSSSDVCSSEGEDSSSVPKGLRELLGL
jgi:hypothetical protein